MSASHPVVFSFGGAEHHLTFKEAQEVRGRLDAALNAAMIRRDQETREKLEALARAEAPPVDRTAVTTIHGTPVAEVRAIEQEKGQHADYIVLTAEERARGFVRPVRRSYVHVGAEGGKRGCGAVTTMGQALAETYSRDPSFYGSTFCVTCQTHLPVGKDGEFVWDGTDERVGT